MQIDFLEVSSYGGAMESSGMVRVVKDLTHPIMGKDVLIIEDIVADRKNRATFQGKASQHPL